MARSRFRWFLTLAVALLATVPAIGAQAPRLTIDELIKDGARYQDQIVQLRGQFDNCSSSCKLCPEGTITETFDDTTCLSVVFGDAPLSSIVHDVTRTMYRFATVTIEASFTSGCIFGPRGRILYAGPRSAAVYNQRTGKQEIGCILHLLPPDLSEARVVEVHARKTLLNGLVDPQSIWDELVAPDPDELTAIIAEWDRSQGTTHPEIFTVKDKQMAADFAVDGSNYDGFACYCLETSCDGRWPTHLVLGMNSPANPFFCWILKKTPDGWRVLPNES